MNITRFALILLALVLVSLAPFSRAAGPVFVAKLDSGTAHTYRLHVETQRKIDLGMGMQREEAVTLDGRFDLLITDRVDDGAVVRLVWRELSAVPSGAVQGTPVTDAVRNAWSESCAALIDQHLEMFVTPDGRIVSIEGISALAPRGPSAPLFDIIFAESDLIALLTPVYSPTGRFNAANGFGVLAYEVTAAQVDGREAETLAGTATLDIPEDLRALPGLEPGKGTVTGTMRWNTADGRLEARTIEAKAAIDAEAQGMKVKINAQSTTTLERVDAAK